MAYKFSETNKVNDEFTKVFGIGFKPFYDGLVSVATKQLWIDVLKFDEWLQKKHGNYEDEGKSMNDVIREHYGDKGVKLVDALTGADDEKGPKSGIVEIEGVRTIAERTVEDVQVTYKPYRNYHKGLDVNQVVYDLMIIAAHDIIATFGTVTYGGNFTAAEMAGTVGYLHQFVWNSDYRLVSIKTETFCCSYHAGQTFAQMAEWEGVMSLAPKKYYRFTVEGKEMPKDVKLKPYTRCHGYKPRTISYADTDRRIAEKFKVLGEMYRSLTSEGMRKAMSVCAAARLFDKKSYEVQALIKSAMRWKLWKDYAKKEGATMMPIAFDETDFQYGPECYKQVDSKYVQVLVNHWQKLLSDYPMPEWPKQGDMVQFKAHDIQKKYRGKYLCEGMTASLSTYGDSLVWRASLRVKKYDNEYFTPSLLEPAPEKPKVKAASKREKNGAGSNSSEREQARPKVKAVVPQKNNVPQKEKKLQKCAAPVTLAEQLRQALLARLAA